MMGLVKQVSGPQLWFYYIKY